MHSFHCLFVASKLFVKSSQTMNIIIPPPPNFVVFLEESCWYLSPFYSSSWIHAGHSHSATLVEGNRQKTCTGQSKSYSDPLKSRRACNNLLTKSTPIFHSLSDANPSSDKTRQTLFFVVYKILKNIGKSLLGAKPEGMNITWTLFGEIS